ncbi:hypothetical protein SDC9_54056 [bioreactor metagenome]|uniref:Uncharacterized protein n=1 Tax=bioreactor metagenome TaxID=1076179 RepID=A0A644WVE2_9ZZZZ
MIEVIQCAWVGIRPTVKMFFTVGSDSPKFSFLAASGNYDLIEIEERCTTFSFCPTLLAVTQYLVYGFRYGVFDFGGFALDKHYW